MIWSISQRNHDFVFISMEFFAKMPKKHHLQGDSRRRPVSCHFCRSRKLRCSREAPCSNCISRSIRCGLEVTPGASPRKSSHAEPEVIDRLRKLEELLGNQDSQLDNSLKHSSESSSTHAQQVHKSTTSPQIELLDKDVAWLESICGGKDLSVCCICLQH